jgi:DNA helicase-2/ATP-dependent DNA helicase PcrA
MINPDDAVSINRIINFPPRGLGETTLNNISNYSRARKVSLWQALLEVEKIESIRPSICAKLNKFTQLIQDFQSQSRNLSFPELVKLILEKSGIKEYYLQDGSEEALDRLDNLREFQTGAEEYAKNFPDRNLEDFLQEVTLISDIDEWEQGELVNLMTVHSAKGLEFPTVFICGLEEGLFPLIREGRVDIEEERRLFYVGATRAMDRLYLSCANYRQLGMFATPSRFLGEIPLQLLDLTRTGGLRQLSIDRQEQFRSRYPSDITFPSASPKSRFSAFKRGDKVLHKKFGEGVISACEGEGEDKMVMVYFQGYGAKKLMLKFAGLEKISYED